MALAASIFLAVSPDLMICSTISLQSKQTAKIDPLLFKVPLTLLNDLVLGNIELFGELLVTLHVALLCLDEVSLTSEILVESDTGSKSDGVALILAIHLEQTA